MKIYPLVFFNVLISNDGECSFKNDYIFVLRQTFVLFSTITDDEDLHVAASSLQKTPDAWVEPEPKRLLRSDASSTTRIDRIPVMFQNHLSWLWCICMCRQQVCCHFAENSYTCILSYIDRIYMCMYLIYVSIYMYTCIVVTKEKSPCIVMNYILYFCIIYWYILSCVNRCIANKTQLKNKVEKNAVKWKLDYSVFIMDKKLKALYNNVASLKLFWMHDSNFYMYMLLVYVIWYKNETLKKKITLNLSVSPFNRRQKLVRCSHFIPQTLRIRIKLCQLYHHVICIHI